MLAPVQTVAPAVPPVSVDEIKAQLRVGHSDDDELIAALIGAATSHLDGWGGILGRALVTQTWQQDFCGFDEKLRLALAPVVSISSITYYDGSNVSQTLTNAAYSIFTDALGPHVSLAPDQRWPATYARPDAVRVTYVAGSEPAAVPAPIRHAIKLLVAHWYENREAVVVGTITGDLPFAVNSLLAPLRRTSV